MKYFIKTFGCQQNLADSERLAAYYERHGYGPARGYADADVIIFNTCTVRQKAEDRVYGLLKTMRQLKERRPSLKVVLTGCLVGTAAHERTGRAMKLLKKRLPVIDEFLPIEKIGFADTVSRTDDKHAWVPISQGCNNFCTYCIVPFARGREISRPFNDIVKEVEKLARDGYQEITLLGQNVNSYGSDLIKNRSQRRYTIPYGPTIRPVMVKHLGKTRIPTLFPHLLEQLAQIKGLRRISFIASNPWDFSDELIAIIARYPHIDRVIHLPVQSGDSAVLKGMNRWYSRRQYVDLVSKIKKQVPGVSFTTDIIVGFPGETKKAFLNTVALARRVGFVKAFVACYSPRPYTKAARELADDVPPEEKKRRFRILDQLINHQKSAVPINWVRPYEKQ